MQIDDFRRRTPRTEVRLNALVNAVSHVLLQMRTDTASQLIGVIAHFLAEMLAPRTLALGDF